MAKKQNEAPPKLVIRRVLHAKREKVFEAWTRPEVMSKWFYPGSGRAEVTADLRVGGRYQNKMILNSSDGGGCGTPAGDNAVIHTGEYLEIIPPEKIVFTWNSHAVTNSRVTVELRDLGGRTELTLTHELLETEELRQRHSGGWEGCLLNLVNYLK